MPTVRRERSEYRNQVEELQASRDSHLQHGLQSGNGKLKAVLEKERKVSNALRDRLASMTEQAATVKVCSNCMEWQVSVDEHRVKLRKALKSETMLKTQLVSDQGARPWQSTAAVLTRRALQVVAAQEAKLEKELRTSAEARASEAGALLGQGKEKSDAEVEAKARSMVEAEAEAILAARHSAAAIIQSKRRQHRFRADMRSTIAAHHHRMAIQIAETDALAQHLAQAGAQKEGFFLSAAEEDEQQSTPRSDEGAGSPAAYATVEVGDTRKRNPR